MKKISILIVVIISFVFCFAFFKCKTMSIKDFLYDKNNNHWDELYFNKNGNVEYNGKVILKNNFTPLNRDNAYDYIEFDILFAAEKIQPEKNCDPTDYVKNGRLGCYIDVPDKK